jgi:16S rRNA processing protein RimM
MNKKPAPACNNMRGQTDSKKNRLEVGKIVGTHGLKGDLKFQHWCDDFSDFSVVFNVFDENGKAYTIAEAKQHKNIVLMKLDGIDSIELAEGLKGTILYAERSELGELPEGEYYLQDLLGIEGYSEDGLLIGKMTDWIETGGGAGKVYVFTDENDRQTLIPSSSEFVKSVDLQEGKMVIKLIEGLVGLNDTKEKSKS